ncbi:hypothetical protein [Streptomyces sp. NPDC052644]|uniref:hypothetical protein n=1 Tax=unclassified Streptomyces TaxID=2593676 RepID=UPI003421373A
MNPIDLSFDQWRTFDTPTAHRAARMAADRVGGALTSVDRVEHLGGVLHRARITKDGREFALIPGGTVRLGFDADRWEPTPGQAADYAGSLAEGYACEPDLRAHLAGLLSPPRTVRLDAVLMAVEDEPLTDVPAAMPAVLAARGLRMPSPDEWEHACGAGARTLFRWGDDCPLDRVPYDAADGPQHEASALGLRIAYDTYRAELSSDPTAVLGGDGGESVCGGYGALLGWLPLATANRNPHMAEFVYGEDGEDLYEDFSVRPVLPL